MVFTREGGIRGLVTIQRSASLRMLLKLPPDLNAITQEASFLEQVKKREDLTVAAVIG